MNNIHQVIFNKNTQQYVVVSELAKSAGKAKTVSADSVDIASILQNFAEKRPLVDIPLSTSGQILAKNCKEAAQKRKVESVTAAITLASAGKPTEAIAVGAASPYVNQAIKDITKESETANIAAHVLWGAIEAELSGNKAQTGAIAAATAELGAKALTQAVYNKVPSELTPEEKETVLEISKAMAGVAVGVTDGGNAASVVTSVKTVADVAERAVENNFLKEAMENPNQVAQLGLLEKGNKVKKKVEKKATEEAVEEVTDVADKYAPHYVVINGQVYGIGAKTVINLRNGDAVAGWTFSPVALPNRFGMSANANLGWITNLEPSDLKTIKGERETANTITRTIEGNAIGASACYKLGCIGYSQTIPNDIGGKKYHTFEVGVGTGVSGGGINQERTYKIGNITGEE